MTTSKIYGIIPCGGTHTQQDFRQRILNLTGSEPHPHIHPSIYIYIYMVTSMLAIVHSYLWINSILNSNRSTQSSMYLSTNTRYIMFTHAHMLWCWVWHRVFCKLSHVILLNYHICFKFSLYVNKIKILAPRKCYKRPFGS